MNIKMNNVAKSESLDKHLDLVAEAFLRDMIRVEYPEWIDNSGECKKCDEYYDSLLNAVEIK